MSKHLFVKCTNVHLCSLAMVMLLLFLPSMAIKAASQSLTVSGVVTSATDKMPLIGVSVLVKGTTNGTITDFDGNYSLGVEKGQTLVFSYIGFVTQEIVVADQKTLNVEMKEDTETLEEVVVVGYGVQKKKLVTGATVQVKGESLAKMNTNSPLQAMQGQTPGVNISSTSGQPGSDMKVSIRGLGTVGNASPLYLIDGVGGDISTLNPADIESIDVLKDAASAAIYGAQAANAKTQVELAQYKYMLPRLQRLWTHLERQGGGSGSGSGKGGSVGLRGPGETQLEMDRRIILNRMSLLKERLAEIDKQKATQRKNRGRMIRVALVGYTNVGKSTIMNLLSKSEVFAENKLFATLDTTVRKVIIDNLPFLLSDTVGFIRKLPTDLVDSFKSTLDEVREADLLVHVVDISHPGFEEQIEVVNKTLADIGGGGKPMILIFNKIDAYTYVEKAPDDLTPRTKENLTLEELMKTWMAKMEDNCLFISARERINIDELKDVVYQRVKELHVQKYPYNDFLYQTYEEEE